MRKRHIALGIGLLLCAAGLAGWIYQIVNGLGVTGLSNVVSWGLYIGTFEFFVGIASGGLLLFSIAYLFKVEGLKPFAMLGAMASLGGVVAAGVIIMVDLGKPLRVLQMILSANLSSPLLWDFVVLLIYAVISVLAVIFQFLPGAKKNRDDQGARADCEKRSKRLSVFALPFVVVMNVVTALMFAVQNTRTWWNSALLPVDSVAVATALGLSFMLVVMILAVGKDGFEAHNGAFSLVAKIAGVAILAHLCFTAVELVPLAWSNTAEDKALLNLLFGTYGLLYGLELILPLLAMLLFLTKLGRGSKGLLTAASLAMIVGGFIHRIMLLLPAFNSISLTIPVAGQEESLWSYPISSGVFTPGQDLFVTFWDYAPTLVEWCVNLLPFGLAVIAISAALSLRPLVPTQAADIPADRNERKSMAS